MAYGRTWPTQRVGKSGWFSVLRGVALTCGELSALIPGLFLPPNGFIAFTPVSARL